MASTRFVALALLGPACGAPPERGPTYRELYDRLGIGEFVLTAPAAPDGFVDFYIGDAVLAEVLATGTFVPRPDVTWSRIRVPEETVDRAQSQEDPVTLSLCDPANGVSFMHNLANAGIEPLRPGARMCSPGVEYHVGRMTESHESGETGVYGLVQIGTLPASGVAGEVYGPVAERFPSGYPYGGLIMNGWVPSICSPGAYSNPAMLLGTRKDDPVADDPLADACVSPEEEVMGRPLMELRVIPLSQSKPEPPRGR